MTALPIREPPEADIVPGRDGLGRDGVVSRLDELLVWFAGLVAAPDVVDGAVRVDRIALLERVKGAVEAVQAVESVAFARSQVAAQRRLDVDPAQVGRGIADQLALACRVSPSEGSRRLGFARDLVLDLPHTLTALVRGDLAAWSARLVVGELAHLDRSTRSGIDQQLADARLGEKSPRACAAEARRLAYRADPQAAVGRCRAARADRRVTLRPAPDTMSLLTGLLPVEQGVACLAALRAETDRLRAAGDPRGRGQIMADTLVQRITGQTAAEHISAEVQIVVPHQLLLDRDDPTPALIPGYGPLPAAIVRDLLRRSRADVYWRRTITEPTPDGRTVVVGIDRRRRRFTGPIAALIDARDQHHCRDPYCTAPIRHRDHIRRHTDHGPTTPDNGRGVCERGNLIRELPGWTIRLLHPHSHTIQTTTPTGHHYLSHPPQPPRPHWDPAPAR